MSSIDRHGGEVEEFDVQLSSGWVRAARLSASGPLVLCLPGLSANLRSFDVIGHRLADAGFQVVAIDLRGRGRSERTPPGTFGWPAHARDAAEVAGHLGVESMCLIGWSMGAFVTMQLAEIEPRLLRKVVLIDGLRGAPGKGSGRNPPRHRAPRRRRPLVVV